MQSFCLSRNADNLPIGYFDRYFRPSCLYSNKHLVLLVYGVISKLKMEDLCAIWYI